MIGRLICWWKGKHRTGKLVNVRPLEMTPGGLQHEERSYVCPRCGHLHHRKVKRFPKVRA